MTSANDQQDPQHGEPTEAATVLHGDKARAEEREQPDAVTLDADTRVATKPAGDEADDGDGTSASTSKR